jgi:small-conductance mechanosensitive channel
MEIKNLIRRILHGTYACFTAITAIYILIVVFLNSDSKEILVDGSRVLLFLVASFLFSLANTLFGVKPIHRVAAYLIHYALYALAVYSCLLLPLALTPSSKYLVAIVIFSVIYAAIMGIRALLVSRYKKLGEEEQEYKKQFSK